MAKIRSMPLLETEAFKALGDENRMKIIRMISDREMCAIELLQKLEISQSTLSHHMKVLTGNSIVNSRKVGAQVHYTINGRTVKELITLLSEFDD